MNKQYFILNCKYSCSAKLSAIMFMLYICFVTTATAHAGFILRGGLTGNYTQSSIQIPRNSVGYFDDSMNVPRTIAGVPIVIKYLGHQPVIKKALLYVDMVKSSTSTKVIIRAQCGTNALILGTVSLTGKEFFEGILNDFGTIYVFISSLATGSRETFILTLYPMYEIESLGEDQL